MFSGKINKTKDGLSRNLIKKKTLIYNTPQQNPEKNIHNEKLKVYF